MESALPMPLSRRPAKFSPTSSSWERTATADSRIWSSEIPSTRFATGVGASAGGGRRTALSFQLDSPLGKLHGAARNRHAISAMLAPQLSAALRALPREQSGFAKPLRPVRNQRAVGRARYGVFIHALRRRKKSRHEIAVLAGSRHDHGEALERGQLRHVGLQREHLVFAPENA